MKRFFLLAALLLLVFAASAQDIIVQQNGEEIRAKVEEVGEKSIRYRKFSNLTGPIYSISRNKVFVIRYQSGAKDVITPLDVPRPAAVSPTLPTREAVARAAVAAKKSERKKMSEFGLRVEAGVSFWSAKTALNAIIEEKVGSQYSDRFSVSSKPKFAFSVSAFSDHYFKKTGEGYIGFGLGYAQEGGLTEMAATLDDGTRISMGFNMKYSQAFANVYYGMRPLKNGFHCRIGFRLGYLAGMKVRLELSDNLKKAWKQEEDDSAIQPDVWIDADRSVLNSFQVSSYLEFGYSARHIDIGLQYLFGFMSPNKNMGNKPSTLALAFGYRF